MINIPLVCINAVDEGDEDSSTAETGPKVTEEESMEDKQAGDYMKILC